METDQLIEAFEAGRIDGAEFRHASHVRVARGLAERYGHQEGLRRMTAGIRAMAARAGRPEAYHLTITRAWYELIAQVDDPADAPELFDKRLLERYYSPERLAGGRDRWLEPDRRPLRMPGRARVGDPSRSDAPGSDDRAAPGSSRGLSSRRLGSPQHP